MTDSQSHQAGLHAPGAAGQLGGSDGSGCTRAYVTDDASTHDLIYGSSPDSSGINIIFKQSADNQRFFEVWKLLDLFFNSIGST